MWRVNVFWISFLGVVSMSCIRSCEAALDRLEFVVRHYLPAGSTTIATTTAASDNNNNNVTSTQKIPDLYGFGFGAVEQSYYDATNQIFYGASELGMVSVTDFAHFATSNSHIHVLDESSLFFNESTHMLTDIEVCGGLLFVSSKNDPEPGHVHVYTAALRTTNHSSSSDNNDGNTNTTTTTILPPTWIQTIQVGVGPDKMILSKDCSILVTANEGEASYTDEYGLINPAGSVSIVRGGPLDLASSSNTTLSVSQVSLNHWTDDELIAKGVHMPLSRNAMIYWSSVLSLNFTNAINNYQPEQSLEPEYLAFSDNESTIYCNCQENNAIVVIDVATNNATDIYSLTLKSDFPVDVIEDGGCENMPIVEGLSFLRSADAIDSVFQNGVQYLITANEGDDVEYGDYAERIKASDIFVGTTLAFPNLTADPSVFSTDNVTLGTSRYFNAECDETANAAATPWCSPDLRLTLGTSMIDYSNPESPVIQQQLVGIGGRGFSIYAVTDSGLDLVWDSKDAMEKEGCAAFPWAHNSIQDEEFAPVNGTFYNWLVERDPEDDLAAIIAEMNDPEVDGCSDGGNGEPGACAMGNTIDDRSTKDGYALETVVTGEACRSLYLVTASEKNSVGFLYDISNITDPQLVQVFHLSPISETNNPGVAYDNLELGDIDPESMQFMSKEQSPTGNAGVFFSGAFSGTVSFWEFVCASDDDYSSDTGTATSGGSSSMQLPIVTSNTVLSCMYASCVLLMLIM